MFNLKKEKLKKNIFLTLAIISAFIFIAVGVVATYKLIENNATKSEGFGTDIENTSSNPIDTQSITWEEITADGVNEELLLKNIDEEVLTEIATELQALVAEAKAEEQANPEIVITEGWTRVWEYDRYKKVLNIGSPAMKPLYLIVYKSPNAGEYEYLCAKILYELSGSDFEWTNSKEFLEKFNQEIIAERS